MSVERRRVLAIVNPSTGTVPLRRIRWHMERTARHHDIELVIKVTEYPDHAIDLVKSRADEFDSVVAVGGDGTLSEVVTGALGTHLTVGIVPTGSTNIVAKDLGIPRLLSSAIRVAMTSSTSIRLDVAEADGKTFMHMSGAGYDAAIMREASSRWKRIFRWLAYVGPGIQHLRGKPFHARLTVDDRQFEVRARMILVAVGGSLIHPRFIVGNGIDRTDGVLDVIVFDPPSYLSILSTLAWVAFQKPTKSRWQHQMRCRSILMEADQKVPFELDGSYRGNLPVNIKMLNQGVNVLVPAVPTPGEIQAHQNYRTDLNDTEMEIIGRRTPT